MKHLGMLPIALSFFVINPVLAANFAPTNGAQLQMDLDAAEINGQDDTITLQANTTYFTADNGNTPFTYNATEDFSLTITGAGAGSSILDGGGAGGSEVLSLTTTGPTAGFQVSGATLQNGVNAAAGAGGLAIVNVGGDVVVDACAIQQNTHGLVAGLFITSTTGDFTISNTSFTGNTGNNNGAASFTTGGNATLSGNTFMQNTGTVFDGALTLTPVGTVTLDNNTFSQNMGGFNGAGTIVSNGGSIVLTGNTFTNNTGTTFDGGATVVTNGGDLTMDQNTLTGNNGGFNGGGTFISNAGNTTFTNNVVNGNTGTTFEGGGVVNSNGGDLIFDRNTFTGNNGGFTGGATSGAMQLNTFTNNTFLNNTGTNFQGGANIFATGGILFLNNIFAGNTGNGTTVSGGGAALSSSMPIDVINNTIFDNSLDPAQAAAFGGGLSVSPGADTATVNLFNNIVYGNTAAAGQGGDIYVNNAAAPNAVIQLFNNDFTEACFDDGGGIDCDFAAVLGADQGANIDGDPLFVDAAAANFQLGANSPSIDAGDLNAPNLPATDHDGNPRVVGGQVDMGALEAQPDINVDPLALAFGTLDVGASSSLIITISNPGVVSLDVTGVDLSDDLNYALDFNGGGTPCGSASFTLPAGESCTIAVEFLPTGSGTFDATVTISSNDPDEAAIVVSLSGIGQLQNFALRGGGCALQSSAPPVTYLAWLILPALLGVFRLRER